MSYLPQSKYGTCSQCGDEDVAFRKIAKDLWCLYKCYKNKKVKEILENHKQRNKIRSLNSYKGNVELKSGESELGKWFELVRKKLTGVCQCGCGAKSQKNDEMYYKFSCCHLFPKKTFHSIATHPNNYVERAFFGGCHSVFDDTSMDRWVGMADWDSIKEKFHELLPFLTDEERATKFYSRLEKLIYKK